MENINLKKFFLPYILVLLISSIFFLYIKHDVANDSSISEWLINYKGGFTRRGIGGELAIFLSFLFDIALRDSIFLIQTLIQSLYLITIYFIFKDLKTNKVLLLAIFAPIFLLYPIAELEVLGRKENFLFLLFSVSILFSAKNFSKLTLNIFLFFSLPVACLLWEQVILYFPFFAIILIFKNNLKNFNDVFKKLFLIFSPSIIVILLIWFSPLTLSERDIMCSYLETKFSEKCYMSAILLVNNDIYFSTFDIVHKNATPIHYIRYALIFIIGFLPINFLIYKNYFLKKENYIEKNFSLKILFLILYLPSILLFIFGYDWGRWINITYSFTILLYIFLFSNSLVSDKSYSKQKILKNFFNNKTLFLILFIIFSFGWNPKTVITGDIASFPGYRIPVKIINYFSSGYF